MPEHDNAQPLLVLRKLTRAIADVVRTEVSEHLSTLAPLFRPQTVLGDHVVGGATEFTRRADQALKDILAMYETVAPAKPFNLRRELAPPFTFEHVGLEISPVEYIHVAQSGTEARRIVMRSPLTWTVSYAGCSLSRLPELLDSRVRGERLQQFILSHLVLHAVTTHQPGLVKVLDAMHLPITSVKAPGTGELPITRIGVGVATDRPSDSIVVESAEMTGMDAFEEVVNVDDIRRMRNPLRERLLEIARSQAPALVVS